MRSPRLAAAGAAAFVVSLLSPAVFAAAALTPDAANASVTARGQSTTEATKQAAEAAPETVTSEFGSWVPVALGGGVLGAPTAATAAKTDARRAATGALISGVPLSRANTKKGAGTKAGYECTAGLPAVKGKRQFIVFAGHCANRGETIYTAWNAGKRSRVGKVTGVSKIYDIAAVETTRNVAEQVWAVRSGKSKVISITGVADAVPGSKVCQHGYRSGTVCGITVQPVTGKQRAAGLVYGKAPAGVEGALPGDSGALVVDSLGRAVGIVSEGTEDGRWIAWVPAKLALRNWNLTLK